MSHSFVCKKSQFLHRFCFVQFKTNMEAERHRKTLSHRTRVKRTRGQPTEVSCHYCPKRLESLIGLKDHIWSEHKESVSQCGFCGESFALAQELAVHVRSKCRVHVGGHRVHDDVDEKNVNQRCHVPGCEFACSSQVMMLLHQSLKVYLTTICVSQIFLF